MDPKSNTQLELTFACEPVLPHGTFPFDRGRDNALGERTLVSVPPCSLEVSPVTRVRPKLSTDRGLLYETDCFNLFAALKPDSIDCIFADPPFNLGKDYGRGPMKDTLKKHEYLKWSFAWIDECVRVLKPGAALFIYILPQWGYHLASHLDERNMLFRHWIALSMKGTFPRGRKLYPAHYALLYFTKGEPKAFNHVRLPIPACRHCGKDIKDYGGHRKYLNPLGLNLTDFWEDTAPARHQKFKTRWHINELKPMIAERCIQIATVKNEIVCDPFGGGGSTFEAAQRLGRYWVGTEISTGAAIRDRFKRHFPTVRRTLPQHLAAVFKDPDPTFCLSLP
jgi:site-specific DNA-methyltransferase (adenine-specific)